MGRVGWSGVSSHRDNFLLDQVAHQDGEFRFIRREVFVKKQRPHYLLIVSWSRCRWYHKITNSYGILTPDLPASHLAFFLVMYSFDPLVSLRSFDFFVRHQAQKSCRYRTFALIPFRSDLWENTVTVDVFGSLASSSNTSPMDRTQQPNSLAFKDIFRSTWFG